MKSRIIVFLRIIGLITLGTLSSFTTWAADVSLSDNDTLTARSDVSGNVIFNGDNASYTVADGVSVSGVFIVSDNKTGNSLYFSGESELHGQIASESSKLDTVIFNNSENGTTINLGYNVWADATTFGNGSTSETTVTIESDGITFGGNLTLRNLFTFVEIGSSRNTVQGKLQTNGAGMAFTLKSAATSDTTTWDATNLDFVDGTGSGKLTTAGHTMDGSELFILTYTTSFRDNVSYVLIENNGTLDGEYNNGEGLGYVMDNSYILTSRVQTTDNNTVLTVTRDNDVYIVKSYSEGHFSNGAALALGTIANQGKQLGDLVEVITKLDINSYGYGNNYVNLARQVQLLAPIANNSYQSTMLEAAHLALKPTIRRLFSRSERRNLELPTRENQVWFQGYGQQAAQSGLDYYDGYDTSNIGLTLGADLLWDQNWLAGVAYSQGQSSIRQRGLRDGNTASLQHNLSSLYLAANYLDYLVDLTFSTGGGTLSGKRDTAIDRTASGKFDYSLGSSRLGIGWRYEMDDSKSVLIPMLGIASTTLKRPEYTETGAGDLSLKYAGTRQVQTRTELGASYHTDLWLFETRPRLSLSFFQSRGYTGSGDITASYTGPTDDTLSTFTTPTMNLKSNTQQLGGSLSWELGVGETLKLGYDLDHRVGWNSHTGHAQYQWRF
jgi:uncharacterized protein with beta-barrel porin domain